MKTTILGHEIEFSWEDGEDHEIQDSDINHLRKCIEEGNNQGELYQTDKENGEVENIGWWEIKSYENETMKQMQRADKAIYALNEIDGLLDQIDTLVMNSKKEKSERVEENLEGINNVVAIIKTKISEGHANE